MSVSIEDRKIPFTLLIETRQLEELNRLSEESDKSKSELLRTALNVYLAVRASAA